MGAPGLGWWVGRPSPATLSAQVPGEGHLHAGPARARPGRTQPASFSAETAWSQASRPELPVGSHTHFLCSLQVETHPREVALEDADRSEPRRGDPSEALGLGLGRGPESLLASAAVDGTAGAMPGRAQAGRGLLPVRQPGGRVQGSRAAQWLSC